MLKEVKVTKAVAAALDYCANDVINDCTCTTTTDPWIFPDVVPGNGGYGKIVDAMVVSESEGITPGLILFLFNAVPAGGTIVDNVANTNPAGEDRDTFVGKIEFADMVGFGTTDSVGCVPIATFPQQGMYFKCAEQCKNLYGILVTRDDFTQTAGDDITITLYIKQE